MTTTETTAITQTAAVAAQAAPIAPKKPAATRKPTTGKGAPKAKKCAKAAKPVAKKKAVAKAATAAVPREFSKKTTVIDLLKRKAGATMVEIMKETGWLSHTVRGFVSGTLTKKMGLAIESTKNDAGERCYRMARK